jgi:hypothetical protein
MSPEDEFAFETLSKAEKVIKALETLARECTAEGLDPFADRIKDCVTHCQNDYVSLQRELYQRSAGKPPKPRGTTH